WTAAATMGGGLAALASFPVTEWAALTGLLVGGAGMLAEKSSRATYRAQLAQWVTETVAAASSTPSLTQVAGAVADALCAAGLTSLGADGVVVEVHPGGEHRCRLDSSP